MRGPGLLWLLQTAAGISMSGPIFVVGVEFLRTGRVIGGVGFLALAAATLYFPTYLVNRIGGPRAWLRRLARLVTDALSSDSVPDSDSDSESRRSSIRDRFRR
ncbi:hypothetical protein [Natrinema sp. SYSU A 869]|uniref:hypothetical protein n=1 Tax=Natrinema sp. SYSU A 869 TaxID=2871694 RepID=UPI001CA3A14E|nr:hypothetical protein [Natrinema sp. SYSU A 869]